MSPANLAALCLTFFIEVLDIINNWLDTQEARKHEERVAALRADPAAEWLRKFGGTDKRTPTPASTPDNTGSRGDR